MRYHLCILLSVLFLNTTAQENAAFDGRNWQAPYFLDTPSNWGIERFLIPMHFAPSINYKGVEDIRFAPGWAKNESVGYWSYTFLWYLDGSVNLDTKIIEKNLSAYYTGLLYANLDTANNKTIKITPAVVVAREIKAEKEAERSFEATVTTLDYMTLKSLTLNFRIHIRKCKDDNKTFVFHEVSPRPYDEAIWGKLHLLWVSLRCKK